MPSSKTEIMHAEWNHVALTCPPRRTCLRGASNLQFQPNSSNLSGVPSLLVRCPQGQVVTQQLHDKCRVLVRVFGDIVQFCNGILECGSSHTACLCRVVEHFVVEHREVQGQTKTDGVRHCKFFCSGHRIIICVLCLVRSCSFFVARGELSNVAVVVALHLVVEDFGLSLLGCRNQRSIQQAQDGVADTLQLGFHFHAILLAIVNVGSVALRLLLLLDTRDDTPGCTAAAHSILVRHRQKIPLLHRHVSARHANCFHVVSHFIVSLSLLCKLCKVDTLVAIAHCKKQQTSILFNRMHSKL